MTDQGDVYKKEKKLINRLKRGDERAFKKLYDKYASEIYGFSLSLVKSKDHAEEIVQDVFLKIWNLKEDLDSDLSFKSFLFTIAKNLSLNILNKAANDLDFRNELFHTKEKFSSTTQNHLLNKEYNLIKKTAINSLSEGRKQIFLMSRERGMSYEEISNELGVSVNTVKTQMKKALKSLRFYLSKYDDFDFIIVLTIYFTFF